MTFCFTLAVVIRLVQWVGVVQWTQQYIEGVGGETGGRHLWEDLDMCRASVKMNDTSRLD